MILGTKSSSSSAHATFVALHVILLSSLPYYSTGVVAEPQHVAPAGHLRRRTQSNAATTTNLSSAIKKGTAHQQHRKLACGELGYHLNQVDKVGCSNDGMLPEEPFNAFLVCSLQ